MLSRKAFNFRDIFSKKFKSFSFIDRFQLPEKWKGGRVEKWSNFWHLLFLDYKLVASDIITESKGKPQKAIAIASGLGLMLAAIKRNPDEQSFYDQMINYTAEMIMVPDPIRNPAADSHLNYLTSCDNKGLLRRTNLIFFSFMWVADYDKDCQIYSAQCKYLKPRYLTFYERIIDIGVFGTWFNLKLKMMNYDVNPGEWALS